MIEAIGCVRLKTGEALRMAAVAAPAGGYARRIRRFLEHKGQPWLLHVDLANRGLTDQLATTFYIGTLRRTIVGNVMIVDDGRVGILGHVFTAPEHRRKGVCQHLMEAALGHYRARGGRVLTLGTTFESPAYWIYHGLGFRSVAPGNGHMIYEAVPGAMADWFAPSRLHAEQARWQHWPGISLLFMNAGGDRIRSFAHGVMGPDGFEGGFLDFQARRERVGGQLNVLLNEEGAVCGAAGIERDTRWPGGVYILDLFVHPCFRGQERLLLRSVSLPRGAKVMAYLDRPSRQRACTLRQAGFRREATLRHQLASPLGSIDVLVYSLAGRSAACGGPASTQGVEVKRAP